jgi:signal transduction histidine kinase
VKGQAPGNGAIEWKGKNKLITVNVSHGTDSISQMPDTIKLRKRTHDMLLRSVKLIVAHTEDTIRLNDPEMVRFTLSPDTTLFKTHYYEKINDAGMKVMISWEGEKDGQAFKSRILHIGPEGPFALPRASITKYGGIITGRILPQLLFGIILVFLSALSFTLAFRSIRDHVILNDLKNDLISNITHELKTPVATLRVALESLTRYNLKDEPGMTEEYLKLATIETKRLEDLINRILDQSMLEDHAQSLNLVPTDIYLLISEVVKNMSYLGKKCSIDFTPTQERITVMADPLYLKGVFINIIDNSIKYCNSDPVITIRSYQKERNAIIEINDNGPGIPEVYHDRIFEKFFRVPSGNIHNVKGSGLGLSFASRVISLHKGEIGVRNLSPGCSFILKLPLS